MTRDEAMKTLMRYQGDHDPDRTGNLIDGLSALGILKLDDDQGSFRLSSDQIQARIRNMTNNYPPQASIFDWIDRLDIAGLKLVEK